MFFLQTLRDHALHKVILPCDTLLDLMAVS